MNQRNNNKKNQLLAFPGLPGPVATWQVRKPTIGLAKSHPRYVNGFVELVSQSIYLMLVLQQFIIITGGFLVVRWEVPVPVKAVVLAIVFFISLFLLYQFATKRHLPATIHFGLRPGKKQKVDIAVA